MNNLYFFGLLILLILLLAIMNVKQTESFITLSREKANLLMLKNAKTNDKIFKINILKNKEDLKNCFKKGSYENCTKLYIRKKNYDSCIKCQEEEKKCYNDLDTLGACDSCGDNLKKNNCYDTSKYACPNPHDVFNIKGVQPYYLEIIDKNNINSPYDQSALFCWDLENYF
jgi:hypothetical protein